MDEYAEQIAEMEQEYQDSWSQNTSLEPTSKDSTPELTATVGHWHVASGLAGYGPDAADSDGFAVAMTPEELADLLRSELSEWIDFECEQAESYGDDGDYKSAWMLHKHASDDMDTLSRNLDNKRGKAPYWQDHPGAWQAHVLKVASEYFPYSVNEGRSNVYAWPCEHAYGECESLED